MTRLAAAQVSPVVFDRQATLSKTLDWIGRAGEEGVDLLVFPEAYFSVYPYWRGHETVKASVELAVLMQDSAITVPGPETDAIARACRAASVNVVLGCNELDTSPGSRTLYNTVVAVDRRGHLLGRRRKLVPTHTERAYWGRGGPEDIATFDMDVGRVGSLVCYEHHMPLLRAAMAQLGEEIHCSLWPGWWTLDDHIGGKRGEAGAANCEIDAAIREYAIENQCYVISSSAYLPTEAVPEAHRELFGYNLAVGGSCIVNPSGMYVREPVFEEECLVMADTEPHARALAKAYIDGQGHYARSDVLQLHIGYPEAPGAAGSGDPSSERELRAELARLQGRVSELEGRLERPTREDTRTAKGASGPR